MAHGEGCWAGGCCDGGAPCPACCSWQGLPSHDGGRVGVRGGLLTASADRWPLCIQVLLTSAQQPSGHTFSISPPPSHPAHPPGNCLKLSQHHPKCRWLYSCARAPPTLPHAHRVPTLHPPNPESSHAAQKHPNLNLRFLLSRGGGRGLVAPCCSWELSHPWLCLHPGWALANCQRAGFPSARTPSAPMAGAVSDPHQPSPHPGPTRQCRCSTKSDSRHTLGEGPCGLCSQHSRVTLAKGPPPL